MKVKLIFSITTNNQENLTIALKLLEEQYGDIDYKSSLYKFDVTNYYKKEMGDNLKKLIISLKGLIKAETITDIKKVITTIESKLSSNNNRSVNIDPGYIDYYKLVLASFKEGGHKLYVGSGVYLDIVLLYDKGWKPFIWTFPDFTSGLFDKDLFNIRAIYKKQILKISN